MNTPIKVTTTRAAEAPRNTGINLLLWVDSVNTASCVLSPNSAKNSIQNAVKNSFQSTKSLLIVKWMVRCRR